MENVIMETYKPFDEYLKKHKYDPETNTIEVNGKRMMAGKKLSNKERNRINKFLRDHKYDPKTETIQTDVNDPTGHDKTRIPFTIHDINLSSLEAGYNGSNLIPGNNDSIYMGQDRLKNKPHVSNFAFKHEEGHFDDAVHSDQKLDDIEYMIDDLKDALKGKPIEPDSYAYQLGGDKATMREALKYWENRLNKAKAHRNSIDKIKDKANKHNDQLIEDSKLMKKTGRYSDDHDKKDYENYADYYGNTHNKYGDKSKTTSSTLYSIARAHRSQRFGKNNIMKYLTVEDPKIREENFEYYRSYILDTLNKFNDMGKACEYFGLKSELTPKEMSQLGKDYSEREGLKDQRKKFQKANIEKHPDYNKIREIDAELRKGVSSTEEGDKLQKERAEIMKGINHDLRVEFSKQNPDIQKRGKELNGIIANAASRFLSKASNKEIADMVMKAEDLNHDSGVSSRQAFVNSIKESCLIMDNDEFFFMEASKNPDVIARKRTVKNLRKLGVDRAHEIDNKKLIDKLERQIADLKKKYDNKEISYDDYYKHRKYIESQMRKLENGIDINITDSHGNTYATKLRSDDKHADSYDTDNNIINIPTSRMSSKQFDAVFSHEAGHAEQDKRYGFNNINKSDYDYTDKKDDYPIKCAKLFLQKNKDKMNTHDTQWTELHADFLSCKKVGFGKMMKLIASFKRDKKDIDNDIENCIKNNEETCKKLENDYLKFNDVNNKEHTLTQADIDKCIELYNQEYEKLIHYRDALQKRYDVLHHKKFQLDMEDDYKKKLDKIFHRVSDKMNELQKQKDKLSREFNHNGVNIQKAMEYNRKMKSHVYQYTHELNNLKVESTTNDYRIRFMEDMKHIHEGHPERCSMKYPPMTPEDKKYMQAGYAGMMPDNKQVDTYRVHRPEPLKIIEKPKKPNEPKKSTVVMPNGKIETWADDYFEFTVFNVSDHKSIIEEMYLSNIITESEYLQLQERIQMITERSE